MLFTKCYTRWIKRLSGNEWHVLLLGSIGLTVALIALAWWGTLQRIATEKTLVTNSAQTQQENLAAIIAENLAQVLDRGRLMSIVANEWFDGNRENSLHRWSAMRAADKAFLRIALYDRNLQQVYASSPAASSAANGARRRDAIRQMLEKTSNDKPDRLQFAPGSERHDQAWQVPLLFPVSGNDGKTRGVLLVTLDLGYFLGLYRDIDFGPSGAIHILKDTGEQIVEASQAGLTINELGTRALPAFIRAHAGPTGIIAQTRDNPNYLTSFRQVDQHPFIVVLSREVREALADHLATRARLINDLVLLTAIFILITGWMTNNIRRQGKLFSALEAADQEKRELIIQLEEEKLRAMRLAAHDHLTGLPNRRMFNELASSHLAGAGRSRNVYALLFLDLDRFKQVNDSLGHHVGDLLLKTIAERLSSTLRESDLVARLGGDEFAVLLTGLENIDDASRIAAKLVEEISRPCTNLEGHDVEVGTSIGIAIFPRDGHDFPTLCQNADSAMYQAKRGGRGRYIFFDHDLNRSADQLNCLEQSFSGAISNHQLVLHFQPKVRFSDFRIIGFEALVRWQHPEFGLILPNEFIARAQHASWIGALGNWVFDACCQELSAWQRDGSDMVSIAHNVSAMELMDPDLPNRMAATLARHGLDGRHFEVEITENSLLESLELSGEILEKLETLGLSIALDNFGNGFSSLSYIRNLPIRSLKIDRGFVSDIHNSPDDALTISSIITLAHNLHMRVVAVGVESLEQLVHLKTAGCDEAQGYFLSRPVSSKEARKLLKQAFLFPVSS